MGFGPGAVCDISLNTKLTKEQRELYQNTRAIQAIVGTPKTVAMVGLSTVATKPSNMVAAYLQDEGFRVIPVHPSADTILGEKVYRSLGEIPFPVDVVDIFRPANEAPEIVEQAIAIGAKAVWMQLRIVNFEAAERAMAAGLMAVMDKCIKMEHGRYGGALHWAGMNTEIVSARRGR